MCNMQAYVPFVPLAFEKRCCEEVWCSRSYLGYFRMCVCVCVCEYVSVSMSVLFRCLSLNVAYGIIRRQ